MDLSYAAAAAVVLAATASSSLTQPLFGLWLDRRWAHWLLPAGVGRAGLGLAAAPAMRSYPLVLLCVFVAAIGVGAFHPEGAEQAGYANQNRLASMLGIFSLDGNIGLALGPLATSLLVVTLGLRGDPLLVLPCAIVSILLLVHFPTLKVLEAAGLQARGTVGIARPRALRLLLSSIGSRSLVFDGILVFLPLLRDPPRRQRRLVDVHAGDRDLRRRHRHRVHGPARRPLRRPAGAARDAHRRRPAHEHLRADRRAGPR